MIKSLKKHSKTGWTFASAIVFSFLAACGENAPGNQSTNDGNVNMMNVSDTCNCEELKPDSNRTYYRNGEPFTGICVGYYANTNNKYVEENLLEGKLHGKVTYYAKNGEVLYEEMYENGEQKRAGTTDQTLTCNCDELEIVKTPNAFLPTLTKLDNIPFSGRCEKKYDDGDQLYMESNYKNGQLHGYTIYYNRDGSTILMEKYENGELVSAVN